MPWPDNGCKNPDRVCGQHTCNNECPAIINHGPGSQSSTHCAITGPHEIHSCSPMGVTLRWDKMTGSTGFFDESPL